VRNAKKRLVLLGALVAAGAALYVGPQCWIGGPFRIQRTVTEDVSTEQLAHCSQIMNLTFPPSARPLGLCATYGMDDVLQLKVEMSRNELQQFIEASPFAGAELGRNQIQVYGDSDLRWWNVDELDPYEGKDGQEAFLSEQTSLPNAEVLNILIDVRRDDIVIVYLEWFET